MCSSRSKHFLHLFVFLRDLLTSDTQNIWAQRQCGGGGRTIMYQSTLHNTAIWELSQSDGNMTNLRDRKIGGQAASHKKSD